MQTIPIRDETSKRYCLTRIKEIPIDGNQTVIFKATDMSPTARQQGLEWQWYTEVAMSGLGSDDTKLEWKNQGDNLLIQVPRRTPEELPCQFAWVFKISTAAGL